MKFQVVIEQNHQKSPNTLITINRKVLKKRNPFKKSQQSETCFPFKSHLLWQQFILYHSNNVLIFTILLILQRNICKYIFSSCKQIKFYFFIIVVIIIIINLVLGLAVLTISSWFCAQGLLMALLAGFLRHTWCQGSNLGWMSARKFLYLCNISPAHIFHFLSMIHKRCLIVATLLGNYKHLWIHAY